jgi:hypothetical protein
MALTSFYRRGDTWHLGQYSALPSGCWSRTSDALGRMVVSLMPPYTPAPNGNVYASGYYYDFAKESGEPYQSQDEFDLATGGASMTLWYEDEDD